VINNATEVGLTIAGCIPIFYPEKKPKKSQGDISKKNIGNVFPHLEQKKRLLT